MVSGEDYPPISNPACTNNVARRKHGSRRYRREIYSFTPRNPNLPTTPES